MYWELARKRALWLQTTSSKQLKILLCLIAVIWLLASTRIQVIKIYIVCRNVCKMNLYLNCTHCQQFLSISRQQNFLWCFEGVSHLLILLFPLSYRLIGETLGLLLVWQLVKYAGLSFLIRLNHFHHRLSLILFRKYFFWTKLIFWKQFRMSHKMTKNNVTYSLN